MRTKALLMAAAALAAGLLTSNAQVYSQNVVGYVNVLTTNGQFALISNPLDNGTNTLATLFPSAPSGSQVQVWTGSGYQQSTKLGASWNPNLTVPVGQGFFIKTTANTTNTFVGSVVVSPGSSVTNTLAANTFYLVSSPIPYADTLGSTNLNLQLASGSQVQVYTGSGFQQATKLGANWNPNLTITPGEGFFVKSSNTTNWVQTFYAQ